MCGVFTIISKAKTRNQRRKLRKIAMGLGILNEKRGDQSWGLWSNEFPITKEVGRVSGAWKFYQRVNNWSAREGSFIAGHTRWATQGGVTKENAHPFLVKDLVLVHNGMVDVDGYEKVHDVDSGQLAHAIAEEGFISAIAKSSGSMGLVLTDGGSLPRVYRSDQELGWVDIGFAWVVSSSKLHIDEALEMAGVKIPFSNINSVPEETLQAPWDADFTPVEAVAKPSRWTRAWGGSSAYDTGHSYPAVHHRNDYSPKTSMTSRHSYEDSEMSWHDGVQKFVSIHDPIWDEGVGGVDAIEVTCDWCGIEFDLDEQHEEMIDKAVEKCPDFVVKHDCLCRACLMDAYRLSFQSRNNTRLKELENELNNILEKDSCTLADVTRRAELESEIDSINCRNETIDRALNIRWGAEEAQQKKGVIA